MNSQSPNIAISQDTAIDQATFRVAIVGAGPSGFYAAEALLQQGSHVSVTMFERLPVPYGLVRYGVAPDHLKLKQVVAIFDRIAHMPGFRFLGNVNVDDDVTIDDLRTNYHAVVMATGADSTRTLSIPGENLNGSHTAGDFVAWYNGHPYYRHLKFNLNAESVVIIGLGNVTLDVARILCKSADELHSSDIAPHALQALRHSEVRHVYVVGRGGPLNAKFTQKELREFNTLENCSVHIDRHHLDDVPQDLSGYPTDVQQNIALFRGFNQDDGSKPRHCEFKFDSTPIAIHGDDHVQAISLKTSTGDVNLRVDMIFSSIGWRTTEISGVPYDRYGGVHANVDGRITASGGVIDGLYTVGWSKRGANGVIGTNRACGRATADAIIEDMPKLVQRQLHPAQELERRLCGKSGRVTDYSDWKHIDQIETEQGAKEGRPRVKITNIDDLLTAAKRNKGDTH